MKTLNHIGLDKKQAKQLAEQLNNLLANYSVFYQNTRGFHWNIKGKEFFELHLKFEELYNDLLLRIDEVAERILTLGYSPDHSYSVYRSKSRIRESEKISDGEEAVNSILESLSILIGIEREVLSLSADANDEGTNALMSDYIRTQEKQVWMYSAYLRK